MHEGTLIMIYYRLQLLPFFDLYNENFFKCFFCSLWLLNCVVSLRPPHINHHSLSSFLLCMYFWMYIECNNIIFLNMYECIFNHYFFWVVNTWQSLLSSYEKKIFLTIFLLAKILLFIWCNTCSTDLFLWQGIISYRTFFWFFDSLFLKFRSFFIMCIIILFRVYLCFIEYFNIKCIYRDFFFFIWM